MAKEGYEAKVGLEALSRAGKNIQLKGHVHEILFKEQKINTACYIILRNITFIFVKRNEVY